MTDPEVFAALREHNHRGGTFESKHTPESRYIVRLYDGFDNLWIDVSKAVPLEEAYTVWMDKTGNGTKTTSFQDIDYYAIFPSDTRMLYASH